MREHLAKAVFRHENAIARHRLALKNLMRQATPAEKKYSRWRIANGSRFLELKWEIEDSRGFAVDDIPDQEQEARAWGDKPARGNARAEVRS